MEKHIYKYEWIWEIIKTHVGANNSINQYEIAKKYENPALHNFAIWDGKYISTRDIRNIIRELRKEGYPILSTPHNPGGYFIPFTYEEAKEWRERMHNKAIKELAIINPVLKACNEMFPQKINQLEIFTKEVRY